jgi:hypothetical protein
MTAILRVCAGFALIAGVWWSMGEAAWSSDAIELGVRESLIVRERVPSADIFIGDHVFSDCCRDFTTGLQISMLVTIFGGVPCALLTFYLRRRFARGQPSVAPSLLTLLFIFQFAAAAVPWLLLVTFMTLEPLLVAADPMTWFLLTTALAATWSLPVLHGLGRDAAPGRLYSRALL